MPIYDYRCTDCSKTYEVFHKVREVSEDIVCPACGSRSHKRLMSVPSVAVTGNTGASPEFRDNPSPRGGCCGGGSCGLN